MASGIARRKACQLCLTPRLRETAIRGAVQQTLRCGITTANAMEGGAFFSDADIEAVQAAARGSVPELLVYPQLMDVDKVLQLGLSRIGGNIYLDGTIGSRTAAVRDNYLQTGHNGLLYANFLEQTAGKIAPGYQADLAVLSGDPLTTPAKELERIQVLQTYKRGQLVYDRGGT